MNTFRIFLICLIASSASVRAEDWSRLPPADVLDSARTELDEKHSYEVSSSREALAVYALKDKNIIPLSESEAKWYTGHYYRVETGRRPYLVRSLYGQGGTGSYSVYLMGRSIWVFHGSLGALAMNQSALVVNLDFEPESVYVSRSIAK